MAAQMKSLRVALIHRDSPRSMDKRMVGIWSYPVPEFTWEHFPQTKGFVIQKKTLKDFDLIFYEDGKLKNGQFVGAGPPVAYYVVDSTLSQKHYEVRRQQAAATDLVLVDHDNLQRFRWRDGPPVRRLSHCVNDKWFKDYGLAKDVDVSFHCRTKGSSARAKMNKRLRKFCESEGYVYASGVRHDEKYGMAFNRSKVTVNLGRTPTNRPHRIFDAPACRTCLVTSTLPDVVEEVTGDVIPYGSNEELTAVLTALMDDPMLCTQHTSDQYAHIRRSHLWSVRAGQLRQILWEELGI